MSNKKKTSGLAIAALVCGFLCWPVGLVLGVLALQQISKSNGELGGSGFAIAGIAMGGVVVVIGILAAIAIPNFIRYKLRSQTAEARTNLRAIQSAQEAFKADGAFYSAASATGGAGGTVRVPWDGQKCAEDCGPDNPAACSQFDCIDFAPSFETYYTYACTSTKDEFTCAAVADLDGNGDAGVWIVGSNNSGGTNLVAPLPAIAREAGCTNGQAGQVQDCKPGVF